MLAVAVLLAAGCGPEPPEAEAAAEPALATYADSVAHRAVEATGVTPAWDAMPYLQFDFAFEGEDGARRPIARHLWDRRTGDYRVEWNRGPDSAYVVLFNVDTRDGRAYLNGAPADSTQQAALLEQAYRRYINDTYWLLAPAKLLDEGVRRVYLPDSSDAETDVLQLTFDGVGLTPGDTYWHYIDVETGRVDRWAFVLQGNPDAAPTVFEWTDYATYDAPGGPVMLAARKQGAGRALLTDRIATPAQADSTLFQDPRPRLGD